MERILIICFVLFCVIPFAIIVPFYNRFVTLKNYIKEAFSTMDVYMKKRWDLIPNLVEVTKGYMQHEKEVLEKITRKNSETILKRKN